MASASTQPRYISLRWRLLLPVFGALLIAVMIGAYTLGQSLAQAAAGPQTNLLVQSGDALARQIVVKYFVHSSLHPPAATCDTEGSK